MRTFLPSYCSSYDQSEIGSSSVPAAMLYSRYLPPPDIPTDSNFTFEVIVFCYSMVAMLLQLLHLYRSVFWLPHSYNSNAVVRGRRDTHRPLEMNCTSCSVAELVPDRVAPADLRRHLPGPPDLLVGVQVPPRVPDADLLDPELRSGRPQPCHPGGARLSLPTHLLQDGTVPHDQPALPGLPVRQSDR